MKFFKIIAPVSAFVLFSGYFFLSAPKTKKASREIASIETGFNFLSKTELMLLNSKDTKAYLNEISKAMVDAGSLGGVFSDVSQKTSYNLKRLLIEEANAAVRCAMKGLHPYVRTSKKECKEAPFAVIISESSKNLFVSESLGLQSKGNKETHYTGCPDGQQMCNPAMVGFDFDDKGKAKLRCTSDSSNENCYKSMRTSGDQMKKSLEVLSKSNPKFWDEFQSGIEQSCLKNGEFNKSDEGCVYVKKQMNHATAKYRSLLTQNYKDLAKKLNEKKSLEAKSSKACKQHMHEPSSEVGIADHRNFNVPGQKVLVQRGVCWRLPYNTIVSRRAGTNTGSDKSSVDRYEFLVPGEDEPIHWVPVEGLGTDKNRTSTSRFYNFKCGPCNDADNFETCIFQQRKAKDSRNYKKFAGLKSLGSRDKCRDLVSKFETKELPDVVFEKTSKTGKSFFDSKSID